MNALEAQGCSLAMIRGQRCWLHPLRALYWEAEDTLLLSDLHLGKAAHFRRSGIAVPFEVDQETEDRLIAVLLDCQPKRTLLLGDLFHSDYNREWESFRALVEQFSHIEFELVAGNHDILHPEMYEAAGLKVHAEPYCVGPFALFHHPPADWDGQQGYALAGHVHPCVHLQGAGRQRERLPCFWFGEQQGVLPAFGAFTGMAPVRPKENDEVFVIAGQAVLRV